MTPSDANHAVLATLVCAVLGLATAWVLIPRIRAWASRPSGDSARGFHHTHKQPVPRLGGLALALAFVVVATAAFFFVPPDGDRWRIHATIIVSALAMFGLGFLDDLRPLGARRKLLGQILISTAAYYGGVQIDRFHFAAFDFAVQFGPLSVLVTIAWLVTLTNLINLIDGIDGLAGGIALMLMGLLCYVGFQAGGGFLALCAAGMVGALVGFLRYNFPPATIYMGDGGAYFLGFLTGLLTVVSSQKGTVAAALIAPLFALALPIVDVTFAILRRGLKGLPVFRADRKHIHHRLVDRGFSRKKTVLVLYSLSLVCLTLAIAVFWSQGRWVPLLFGVLCLTFIGAVRVSNFSRDWMAVGRLVGNSLEMRKETRYALTLSRWLEVEAERCHSLGQLWNDFTFMVAKLGFNRATLWLPGGTRNWSDPSPARPWADSRELRLDLHMPEATAMAFHAAPDAMTEHRFELMSELAAEAWTKAARRWHKLNPSAPETGVNSNPADAPAHGDEPCGETTG